MTFRPHLFALLTGVLLAMTASRGTAQVRCDSTGDCLSPHGGPGCADPACCEAVCDLDPFCCKSWDASCVNYADATCVGLCGATASGSCFSIHPSPGCNDADCCTAVCAVDPFCCSNIWDGNCVFYAGFSCSTGGGECGDADSGDCYEPNGTPACSDTDCCNAVCLIDPRCCDVVWDTICVAVAETACLGGCEIGAKADALLEAEDCESSSNDPCDGGQAEPIPGPALIAGTFQPGIDTDVFEFDFAELDNDGDGLVRIRVSLLVAHGADLLIGPADCTEPPIISDSITSCINQIAEGCIPAGPTWIKIRPNAEVIVCDATSYAMTVDVRDTCDETCGTGGDCLEPGPEGGCEDAECCAAVCTVDPACCTWEWDGECAILAAQTCGGPPPANDECADAINAPAGLTPFRQLLATPDGPAEWCGPDGPIGGDVWFRHPVRCTGSLFIGTCNVADFDTVVEVFRGGCDGTLELVGCADDSGNCGLGTSLIEVSDAVCGEVLLIRVLDADGVGGNGHLSVDCFGTNCPCPADLDGNGSVGGSDLGLLFVAWGPCPADCAADLDGDGVVGGSDLGLLFVSWGDEC